MERLNVRSHHQTELVDITGVVQQALSDIGAWDGVVYLFCPHTTAGLTLNENWDPDVQRDMLLTLDDHIAPPDRRHRHGEGNSPAHVKSSLFGANTFLLVEGGKVQTGRWQGVYLAEFDGPRPRQVWLKFMGTMRREET